MTVYNKEIADIFNQLADLLEISNDNPFRIRAYRNAAMVIGGLSKNLADMIGENKELTDLPGIGEDLAEKIKVIVKTGELPLLNKMEKSVPPVLSELLKIEGLGPSRVRLLYKKLKIKTTNDLKTAIKKGELLKIKGFGEKIQQKILSGLEHLQEYSKRINLADAVPIANTLVNYLKKCKDVIQVECAGSVRRRKETIGDIDVLASSGHCQAVIDYFVKFNEISKVISKGDTRSTVRMHSGVQVDLRVVSPESFGAALVYFTGSKAHNIAIRKIAIKKKLKMNEYGVFKGKQQVAGKTEPDVYSRIGMAYVEPEMRENNGEIELAIKNKLPRLITLNDICGDLHCHTRATDGAASIEEMAEKAIKLGYQYIGITDHSRRLVMVNGLDEKALLNQIKLIDKINQKLKNIVILKSIEVDILQDGQLDLSDDILKELDYTVCSIHSHFDLTKRKQTERIIRAMDNPYFTILGHPTGRLINKREPYEIDMEKIMLAAKERHCFLEINAQPARMDLNEIYCKLARDMQVKVVISTDAHSVAQMDLMQYGVYQARRGWLEAKDVLNTYRLKDLLKAIKRSAR